MGEEDHRDLALGDDGDSANNDKQMAADKEVAAAAMAMEIVAEDEVMKSYNCRHCPKVFGSGKALGGHMSSVHRQSKKSDSSSKKLKSKQTINHKNSSDSRIGKFFCEQCGKDFPSQKAVHGHMRMHGPDMDRRGMAKPPTEQEIENPPENALEPRMLENEFDDLELLAAAGMEDLGKNLDGWKVKGWRGQQASTKPHMADSPDTCSEKKKLLLTGDRQESKNIFDDEDYPWSFKRAFGKFLDIPWHEIQQRRYFPGTCEIGTRMNVASSRLESSPSDDACSKEPDSRNSVQGSGVGDQELLADSKSKDCETLTKSPPVDGGLKDLENEKRLEGTSCIETTKLTEKKKEEN